MKPEQEIFTHIYWLQNADRLLFSAEALLEKLRIIQDDPELDNDFIKKSEYIRALLETNYMLLGYALENSIKGYSIFKYFIANDLPEKGNFQFLLKKVWKVKSGHDLIGICQSSGLLINEIEKELIIKLQANSLWKGRYHIPNTHEEILDSITPGEKDRYTSADRRMTVALIERIKQETIE